MENNVIPYEHRRIRRKFCGPDYIPLSDSSIDEEYMEALFIEQQKINTIKHLFPICSKLVDQEMTRLRESTDVCNPSPTPNFPVNIGQIADANLVSPTLH